MRSSFHFSNFLHEKGLEKTNPILLTRLGGGDESKTKYCRDVLVRKMRLMALTQKMGVKTTADLSLTVFGFHEMQG